ncbi:hypothetical protein [Kitasatospora purpeofusca]|uniref:hypothetical protein n=1 Tax=Kitasatospora purpeofusca TaxID=67352 RepID=UPI002259D631|nr:hypothetical protein [Kitasatospora purpeofusca]MCX4752921.1 hypothetical protein [Kitasatospora purpeofusca]WSR32464.1 hypothetical protein OG715_16610 [Kitasatospora purpeofusca]WSR40552.1 hypothetical protein OG196_16395 [Kitasatospora purpeofusca]
MDPLLVTFDCVSHPTVDGEPTLVCLTADVDGHPVALLLDEHERADLIQQLTRPADGLAPGRPGRRRRTLLVRRTGATA